MARKEKVVRPLIGFLNPASAEGFEKPVAAFHLGLKHGGYVDGRNVDIEFSWAKGKYDLLDKMATDLVKKIGKRGKGVIATTGGTLSAKAAQRATEGTDIPILFVTGRDPVKVGLVASYEHPGGNATGVTVDCAALVTQRL